MVTYFSLKIPYCLGYKFSLDELNKFVAIGANNSTEIVAHSTEATAIVLTGPSQFVNQCKAEIMEFLFKNKTDNAKITFPKIWTPQKSNLELVAIASNSTEWNTVQQRFTETLKNKIVKIERIQNKWLWEKVNSQTKV